MCAVAVSLTQEDHIVLNSYKSYAEGLSNYLGSCYEIVVHSLENLDNSAIKVLNGFHSGRSEGAPITDLALQMLAQIKANNGPDYISYCTTNPKGEPLYSTTIVIRGSQNKIIGLMCINLYLNSPLNTILNNINYHYSTERKEPQRTPIVAETFAKDIDGLISEAFSEAMQQTQTVPANTRNRQVVSLLEQKGIFNLKDSVTKVAALLGISKNTVYLYLRKLEHSD